jgi:hypothetical protein
MSRRPAKITQADVARAVRAARQAGAGTVRLLPDGTICIDIQAQRVENKPENAVDADKDITL